MFYCFASVFILLYRNRLLAVNLAFYTVLKSVDFTKECVLLYFYPIPIIDAIYSAIFVIYYAIFETKQKQITLNDRI